MELDSTARGFQLTLHLSVRVDYDIKVPRSVNVTIKTTNGEVDVAGLGGALTVDATNGRITGTGLGNGADVSSVNGRLNLEFAKLGDAGVRCKTTNGQIVVTIPSAVQGHDRRARGERGHSHGEPDGAEHGSLAPAAGCDRRRRRPGNPAGSDQRRNPHCRKR